MSEASVDRAEFDALRAEIAELRQQLQALTAKAAPPAVEGLDEETVGVLAAAVAAFFGKRATIKYVRRISDDSLAWRTHGRASVAASHKLPRTKGW